MELHVSGVSWTIALDILNIFFFRVEDITGLLHKIKFYIVYDK